MSAPWLRSPEFRELLPYIKGEPANDVRAKKHMRLEWRGPADLRSKALNYRVPCVNGHRMIHPFRRRRGRDATIYFAVSCPLEDNVGCARSGAARVAYDEVEAMLVPASTPAQGELL